MRMGGGSPAPFEWSRRDILAWRGARLTEWDSRVLLVSQYAYRRSARLRSCHRLESRSRWRPGAEWASDLPFVAERIDDPAKTPAVLVADG